ncbi:MAG TPA: hypothetical protein DCO79_02620, partial [Spirochaeta sp.]|nr:hypothetical protein [Spirochaeta sp.]
MFRLLPLILILILSGGIVSMFRSADLRNKLNDSVFDYVSSRTFQVAEDYFNPLFEIVSSSVLWTNIGNIDSIGSPEDYIDLLEGRLNGLGTVSSFSISDSNNDELDLLLTGEIDDSWKIISTGSAESLSSKRISAGIEYLSIDGSSDSDKIHGSVFRISTPYLIPYKNVSGITLCLEVSGKFESGGLTICLDLPLDQMANRLQREGAVKDAVIFILMPSHEDFIILPVDDLLKTSDKGADEITAQFPVILEAGAKTLVDEITDKKNIRNNDDRKFRFTHDEQTWLAEFMNINVGNENLAMGTLIPEDALWTAQISLPLQIFLLFLLASTGFLVLRLIQDYKKVSKSPYHIEEELRAQISEGETLNLEFKSSLRWDYREEKVNKALEEIIVKSVAAFNNAEGGTLLIGVGDAGEILGIEKDYDVLRQTGRDYYEIHLRNLLSSKYGVGYTSKNITVDFPWLS